MKAKRVRRDPETTRGLILDATEAIMVEEGYAAVSTRRVAQALGIHPATIHYYYPATDDLFIALHRRMMDRQVEQADTAQSAGDPLLALWQFQSSWSETALGVEFLGLSNHRKGIQDVIAGAAESARLAQARALGRDLAASGHDAGGVSPMAAAMVLTAVARMLANEARVGITCGHDEVRALVEEVLGRCRPA